MKKTLILLIGSISLTGCVESQTSLEDRYSTDINPYNENVHSAPIQNLSPVSLALQKMSNRFYSDEKEYSFSAKKITERPLRIKTAPKSIVQSEDLSPIHLKKQTLHHPISNGLHIPGE